MAEKIIAIVPAAGLGTRFGGKRSKQFAMLGGKPLIIRALETFQSMPEISEIIPVIREQEIAECTGLFREFGIKKARKIAPGGRERQDSVYNGLRLIRDTSATVLIHDGARPLVEPRTIRDALRELKGSDGVVVGVTPKDTIKQLGDRFIQATLQRDSLFAVQTPQIFPYRVITEAYERAMGESFYSTDDSALVEHYGGKVRAAAGSYLNIKVTTPEDLAVAELFLAQMEARA
ncbi:MAG: 2-C-methyl-D-erythritol 4-phosphate cytidylyltransferase [Thermodesulfovibrionales bacterium]